MRLCRLILWLTEKHIEEGLDPKNVRVTILKYLLHHRKHRYELVMNKQNSPAEFI